MADGATATPFEHMDISSREVVSEEQRANRELRERSLQLWLVLAGKQAHFNCYGGYVFSQRQPDHLLWTWRMGLVRIAIKGYVNRSTFTDRLTCEGVFRAVDLEQSSIFVSSLTTPMGTYDEAELRGDDLISLTVEVPITRT